MANNIYIGMRYVPIYVGDYDSETVYEPLSIVAYNGASYTSKQSVPAGILPTNTTYWAKSSDFNAQYSELDGRITTAQDKADEALANSEENADAIAALEETISTGAYIDASKYGVTEDSADISTALNNLLSEHGGTKAILMPQGQYTSLSPIIINKNSAVFICFGTINGAISGALVKINASDCDIYIRRISNSVGDGVQVGDTNMESSIGNNNLFLPHIYAGGIGLHYLVGTRPYGIQNINFYGNRIDYHGVGILLEQVGSNSSAWINENRFFDFWCVYNGTHFEGGIGIQTLADATYSGRFNGNRFMNFSAENNANVVSLVKCRGCNFENIRLIEQVGRGVQFICDSDTTRCHFSSVNGMLDLSQFNDQGIENIYDMYVAHDGVSVCNQFTFRQGGFLILDGYIPPQVLVSTQADPALLRHRRPMAVICQGKNSYTITLPLSYSWDMSSQPIVFIADSDMTGSVRIVRYNGTLVCTVTAGTAWAVYCGQARAVGVQIK